MTERELIRLMLDYAYSLKPAVYVLHFPDYSRLQGDPGLPDLLLLGEYRLAWRELKCDGTQLRADQRCRPADRNEDPKLVKWPGTSTSIRPTHNRARSSRSPISSEPAV